ncbi:DUF4255 domain-containing protein [Nocardioides sp.]|uniref:DUF4255 domain-containing protein n=1 Tax=Nocardioides sp. TaxID=35761 RepID=UPI003513BBAC
MFIRHVDTALEQLVRQRLPLPEDLGEVSFEQPTGTWSAQVTRVTVNLYLYEVSRSAQPSTAARMRMVGDGPAQVRRPQPMIQLGYLLSVWAGSPRDEHQVLGDLVSMLAGIDVLPAELAPPELSSPIQLAIGDERNMPRELWTGLGGQLRASLQLRATVAADTHDWSDPAPSVERVAPALNPFDAGARA